MPYMNVTEVESALVALASTYSSFCELITLPNQTIEGRTSHAIRLGTKPANSVDAYYLTGGVHAREWGSCEILVNVATDLCAAYSGGTGVGYGGKYFSAAEVRALIEQFNIIIFPDVNPDGRNFSQTSVALWRKNRDAVDSGGDPSKVGIDINRNQDFLWDSRPGRRKLQRIYSRPRPFITASPRQGFHLIAGRSSGEVVCSQARLLALPDVRN